MFASLGGIYSKHKSSNTGNYNFSEQGEIVTIFQALDEQNCQSGFHLFTSKETYALH